MLFEELKIALYAFNPVISDSSLIRFCSVKSRSDAISFKAALAAAQTLNDRDQTIFCL